MARGGRGESTLRADHLECVRGRRVLFRELHFELAAGAALRIRGDNGSGKTSLLRILCGLSQPERGVVCWNGEPVGRRRAAFHQALAYAGHRAAVKGELTAAENLAAAVAIGGGDAAACGEALRRFGLGECADVRCARLSAGQRQRLALARVWLRPGGVWLLDEPAAALDEAGVALLGGMLERQLDGGGMVVFTSHREVPMRAAVGGLELAGFR